MADLTLDDVLPFDRPMSAGPNDTFVGMSETGDKIYETLTGQQYSIREATKEETDARQPLPVKAEKWVDKGMPLPSWDEITTSVKAIPKAIYDSIDRVTDGTGTFGDVMGSIGASAAPGMASRVVSGASDASVVSAMGATHKVPRYGEKPPKKAASLDDETYDGDGFLQIGEEVVPDAEGRIPREEGYGNVGTYQRPGQEIPDEDYFGLETDNPDFEFDFDPTEQPEVVGDGFFGNRAPDAITFRDPLIELFNEMEIPAKGLKGSELIKQLQDNPTVRNSQLTSMGIFDKINPQTRYPKEEIAKIFQENHYMVSAVPQTQFQSYQRQFDLMDKETDYTEYAINAEGVRRDQPKFKANSQHYQNNTLAHVRLSDREGKDGPYVLIEELQSDLLQKGYRKPNKDTFGATLDSVTNNFVANDPSWGGNPESLKNFTKEDVSKFTSILTGDYIEEAWRGEEVAKFVRDLSLDPRFEGLDERDVSEILYAMDYFLEGVADSSKLTTPPIAKTEEGVRLAIDTAIAHASKKGVTKIVIPPFRKIVEKRFSNEADIAKAMDPKSGFYATYVTGLNKVLKDLQQEFGANAISVRKRPMEYDPNKKEHDFGEIQNGVVRDTDWDYDSFDLQFRLASSDYAGKDLPFDDATISQLEEGFQAVVNRGDGRVRDVLGPEGYKLNQSFFIAADNTIPNFSSFTFYEKIIDGMTTKEALESFKTPKPPKPANVVEEGTEIDFGGIVEQNYDLNRPKFAEGGMVLDPVSKNPVPVGATPKEVRDDVPIMVSEGEYVIPANVVRFLGLDKIEKLVSKAKTQLEDLDKQGRIGGKSEDDLPFSPEELQAIDAPEEAPQAPPKMAEGGLVPTTGTGSQDIDPVTGMPKWMSANPYSVPSPLTPTPPTPATPATTPTAPTTILEKDKPVPQERVKPVNEWSPEQFEKYAVARTSPAGNFMQMMASMVPGGGLMAKAQQKNLERKVPVELEKMLSSQTDLQGNPLTTEQMASLSAAYEKMTTEPLNGFGLKGLVRTVAEDTGLVQKRQPTPEDKKAPKPDGIVSRVIDAVTQSGKTKEEKAAEKEAKDKEKADKEAADKAASSTTKK